MTYTRDPQLAEYIDGVLEKNPIETEMVRRAIRGCAEAGNPVESIFDGEAFEKVDDEQQILDIVFNLDEVRLYCISGAMIFLVFGNDPDELFCDYSVSLEKILAPITEWATEAMDE